jgi:hypothetical protein
MSVLGGAGGFDPYLTDSNLVVTESLYKHKITSRGWRCLAAYSALALSEYGISQADQPVDITGCCAPKGCCPCTARRVGEVLDWPAQAGYGLDHPRSGELVLVAEPGAWFTNYYWLDETRRD